MALGVAASRQSDEVLLAATRDGSSEAFLALYERYRDLAWRVARSVSLNDADAEDAAAEAFSRVYRVATTREIQSFRSYLAAAVRNAATDVHRRRTHPDEPTVEPPATSPDVEDRMVAEAEAAMVGRAFASLPERHRAALWLAEVERFSTSELGHVLRTSPNGAAALAMRARERLREAFLGQHLRLPLDPECAEVTGRLAAYVRGSASARVVRRVDAHLETCGECAARLAETREVNRTLAAVIPVAPLGLLARSRMFDAGGLAETAAQYGPSLVERMAQPVAAAVAGLLVGTGIVALPDRSHDVAAPRPADVPAVVEGAQVTAPGADAAPATPGAVPEAEAPEARTTVAAGSVRGVRSAPAAEPGSGEAAASEPSPSSSPSPAPGSGGDDPPSLPIPDVEPPDDPDEPEDPLPALVAPTSASASGGLTVDASSAPSVEVELEAEVDLGPVVTALG